MTAAENAKTTATTITDCNNFSCIADRHILVNDRLLQQNSRILDCLVNDILLNLRVLLFNDWPKRIQES